MVFVSWWLALVVLGGLVGLFVVYKREMLQKYLVKQPSLRVAHSARITALPEYKRVRARYRRGIVALLILFSLSVLASLVLVARPATQNLVTPAEKSRDIMLCLDVSGSMSSVDAKLVDIFLGLVHQFRGQRVGLNIFNMNVSQVFPLTDDYDLIEEQLAYAKKMFTLDKNTASEDELTEYYGFVTGANGSGMKLGDVTDGEFPASNAGIGLAGCVRHLGENEAKRSQSVVLATDNELSGDPKNVVVSVEQAMLFAKQKGVRVYSLDPGVYNEYTEQVDATVTDNLSGEHAVLKNYTLLTSGNYYRLSSTDILPDVIAQISKQEAALFVGESQYAVTDAPLVPFVILLVSVVGVFVVFWRLKL